jgi:hypothetical protein
MILEAARRGLRVSEVPITLRRRASGITKKPTTMRYAWGFTKAIARTWLRQPPGKRVSRSSPRWVSNSAGVTLKAKADDPGQETRSSSGPP